MLHLACHRRANKIFRKRTVFLSTESWSRDQLVQKAYFVSLQKYFNDLSVVNILINFFCLCFPHNLSEWTDLVYCHPDRWTDFAYCSLCHLRTYTPLHTLPSSFIWPILLPWSTTWSLDIDCHCFLKWRISFKCLFYVGYFCCKLFLNLAK